ncbi:MAG: 30S ribosomal protein S20 [Planctomycetota bacterium]
MGNSVSATKRERQNLKRKHRNRGNMNVLRKEMKRIRTELEGKPTDANKILAEGFKALDRAACKNAIPKKRADRKKSRLALALNRAAKATVTPPQP